MPDTQHFVFNILAKDVERSVQFYQDLLGFERLLTRDWYVVLGSRYSGLEIGIIDQVSEFVPRGARGVASGTYLTLVVDDVVSVVERARALGVEIVEEPVRIGEEVRAIIRDPNALVIDITTPAAQFTLPPRHHVG